MRETRLIATLEGNGQLEFDGAQHAVRYAIRIYQDFEVSPGGAATPLLQDGRGVLDGLGLEYMYPIVRGRQPLWLTLKDGARALIFVNDAEGSFAVNDLMAPGKEASSGR
ncbi:MAG TPA: hypothetical protein VN442_19660 [Bryobacteraceae bacterium]|nr:hypothetical protein [Bryobacteraceae bacterium]